jgi:electron transport complex protein RnfD
MWSVAACLLPAAVWGVLLFGINALYILLASITASVLTELLITSLQKKYTLFDGSAFLTGLLIGFNMPPYVPAFIPIVASIFAIAIVKHTFGGLGRNWMNPALAGRVFVMFSWTNQMTTWTPPGDLALIKFLGGTSYSHLTARLGSPVADIVSGATPLAMGADNFLTVGTYWDLLLGNKAGCIGEVSVLLLLIGAVYLFFKKIITWETPVAYLATFSLLIYIFGGTKGGGDFFTGNPLFHLLTGGIVLGAFYMATDLVTSPLTFKGRLLFGAGAGFFTFLIRTYGGLPEGVSLAIILMNITVPLIDRYTKTKVFGSLRLAKLKRKQEAAQA